jgi:hypothetical protein
MVRRSSGSGHAALTLALLVAVSAAVSSAHGQTDRSAYLIQLMGTSSSFRVRAQAALSLGGMGPSGPATQALISALRDDEATVRAAAAQSLGRIGDTSALGALHGIEHDSESAVAQAATAAIASISSRGSGGGAPPPSGTGGSAPPSGPARFYIGVGDPGSTVSGIDPSLLPAARQAAVAAITPMSGVVVAPQGETAAQARAAISSRSLHGYFIDVSITDLTTRPDGAIHTAISIVVQEYPSHNIIGSLSGAATASGVSGVSGQRAVIQAAVQSALRSQLAAALH